MSLANDTTVACYRRTVENLRQADRKARAAPEVMLCVLQLKRGDAESVCFYNRQSKNRQSDACSVLHCRHNYVGNSVDLPPNNSTTVEYGP